MIYLSIIFIALVIIGIATYAILSGWINSHGLAILSDSGKWHIDSTGWEALWPTLTVGAAAGLIVSLVIFILLSESLHSLFSSHVEERHTEEKAALSELRQELNKRQAGIDAEIKKNLAENISSYEATIEILERSRYEIKKENELLKSKNDIIASRLKGAQQKAARIKKSTTDER